MTFGLYEERRCWARVFHSRQWSNCNLLDSEIVARFNHLAELLARSTATVVQAVADRLITLPPRVRRVLHDAMLHRRRNLIHRT